MKLYEMYQIDEVLNFVYPYSKETSDKSVYYYFEVDDKEVRVEFGRSLSCLNKKLAEYVSKDFNRIIDRVQIYDKIGYPWSCAFSADHDGYSDYDPVDMGGKQYQVLSTVANIVLDFLKNTNVCELHFSSETIGKVTDRKPEGSRTSAYEAIIKKVVGGTGFKYTGKSTNYGTTVFVLIKEGLPLD